MTDEEFIFRQEIKEKKAAGSGAYHKKCGSKSKKVTFPSDYLTNAEKKRRNGKVKTYNISRVITSYEDFKQLPPDLMRTYIINCRDRFGAMECDVAASMNVKRRTFATFVANRNIGLGKGGRRKLSPDWCRFVLGEIDINGKELVEEKVKEPKIEAESIPAINWTEPEKPIKITDDDIPLGVVAACWNLLRALEMMLTKLEMDDRYKEEE